MPKKSVLVQIQITSDLGKRLGLLAIHLDKRSKRQLAAELLEKAIEDLEKQQQNKVSQCAFTQ